MAYLGTGIAFFQNLETGAATEIENATKISIKGNSEAIPITSNRNDGTVGSLLYNVIRKKEGDFTLEIDAYPPLLLATQLMGGEVENVVEGALSATNEVQYPTRGMGLLLANNNVSAVTIDCANATGGSGFTVNGAAAIGATVITLDGTTAGTIAVGDVVKFGASDYKYRISEVNITGTNPAKSGTITLSEGLIVAVANDAAVTHVASLASTVDFTISDAKTGYIQLTDKVPSGDKTLSLGALSVDYSYGVRSFKRLKGGIKSSIPISLKLNSTNDVDGSEGLLTVYRVRVMPTAEFDWMSTTPQKITLEGKLEVVAGHTETFVFDMDIVNA